MIRSSSRSSSTVIADDDVRKIMSQNLQDLLRLDALTA